MSNFAIIENGVVVNTVVADEDYAAQMGWVACPQAGIGWSYEDGVFIPPVVEQVDIPTPQPPTKEQLLAQLQLLQSQIQELS